jgi:hypothetical protein
MHRHTVVGAALTVALLAGCGAEVASTAVTTGKLQATQAEQAKAQAEKVKAGIADAMQRTEAAASSAGNQ